MARFFRWRDSVVVKRATPSYHRLSCDRILHAYPPIQRWKWQSFQAHDAGLPDSPGVSEDCHPEDFVGTILNTQLEMLQASNEM
jgi:hypothetical protein